MVMFERLECEICGKMIEKEKDLEEYYEADGPDDFVDIPAHHWCVIGLEERHMDINEEEYRK